MGGEKKEYRQLPGLPFSVLGSAVSAFAAITEITSIIITVPDDPRIGEAAARNALPPELLAGELPAVHFVPGGATRRASVFNALSLLSSGGSPPGMVLIHDGARPWVSPNLIKRVIAAVHIHRAVVPLMPLVETPKETVLPLAEMPLASLPTAELPLDGSGAVLIQQHLKRSVVGTAQTPQGFAFPEIFTAHEQAACRAGSVEYTDDAEIWAAFCGPVAAIIGEPQNRKITFEDDIC